MKKITTIILLCLMTSIGLGLGIGVQYQAKKKKQADLLKQVTHWIDHSLDTMIYIKGGQFMMGASQARWQAGNNTPAHTVILSSFYMSKTNLSYGEYDTYTQATNQPFIQSESKGYFFRDAQRPVDSISWYRANRYCQWLAEQTQLPFSLPTEAQWEYAARNRGKKSWDFATNDGTQKLGKNFPSFKQLAHNKENDSGTPAPLPVGSIPCNPLGLCGMNGQVNQWVKDWYDRSYYAHSPVDNPQGPETGKKKTIRGGAAGGSPEYNNVYNRYGHVPEKKWAGFRCVINSDKPIEELKTSMKK